MALCSIRENTVETQNARSASRRAQFQLWIFSYTILAGLSKNRVSRVMIACLCVATCRRRQEAADLNIPSR